MKTSVIISTYNRPSYLNKVLDGYLHQTRPPDEIIVADDGSGKETKDLVESFMRSAIRPAIVHVWHEDRGFRLSTIRNRAIAKCSGEYVIISDDDTIPAPQLVEDHLRFAERGFFIQGHRVFVKEAASKDFSFSNIRFYDLLALTFAGKITNAVNALRMPVPLTIKRKVPKHIRGCNMSFFRDDLIAVNGFNEDFEGWGKEDSELVGRLYKYGVGQKDLKWRGVCFHLYHQEFSRNNLRKNVALLGDSARDSAFFCKNGLDKHLASGGKIP